MTDRELEIIQILKEYQSLSSGEIFEKLNTKVSYATLKRTLSKLQEDNILQSNGQGKGTKYIISEAYSLLQKIDIDSYYQKEIDEREIIKEFNFSVITNTLAKADIFTTMERKELSDLHEKFEQNISDLSESQYLKEFERLAIDLSWKSSQIEGNTYSLLETERLLKEKETAAGKTKEEAVMLLNHKDAIDFIIENPDYLFPLEVRKIEDIHSILMKELQVERNLRTRRVGISGTNYKPLDNEFQIREALSMTCDLINSKESVFDKALLALILISYIQPFMDGNKRTARIVSNSILMNFKHCPLSFRTVDSIDYKKAMLLFYEQNNISSFKNIFTEQFEFAVKTYF
ncbi:MAG: Fic family protein [Reichenbachiella sp.]